MNNAQIKKLATIRLGGNWGNCIAISTTMLSIGLLIILGEVLLYHSYEFISPFEYSYIDYLRTTPGAALLITRIICYYLLLVPEIGYSRTIYARLSMGENFIGVRWSMRHQSFGSYVKTIFIQTLSIIYQAILFVPLVLSVFVVTYYIERVKEHMSNTNLIMFMLSLLFSILLLCLFVFLRIKLKLLPYIMTFRRDVRIFDAFVISFRLMKGNTLRYIFLLISFAKYFALCVFIFPILVVLPYYNMSMSIFCQSLISAEKIDGYLAEKEKQS